MIYSWYKKGFVAGVFALLISISILPMPSSQSINNYVSITSSYDMDLFCDGPYQNVKQGETATFIVEITNTGTLDDTYDIIAGSIEDIICKVNGANADEFNPYQISVQASELKTFEVTAEVWESVPLGEWSIFVEACSQNDSEVYDELILTANVQKKNKSKSLGEESIKKDDSGDLNLGFILCRITYIEIGIWWETGFHGQKVELKDLDKGEVITQGKTGFFGFIFFPFLPIGHDYRITAYTDYGTDSRKIEDLGLFQKVKICFINK